MEKQKTVLLKQSTYRKYRRLAVIAAEEMLSRAQEFELTDAERQAARRIRKHASPDKLKDIDNSDVLAVCRRARIHHLIPEEIPNLNVLRPGVPDEPTIEELLADEAS